MVRAHLGGILLGALQLLGIDVGGVLLPLGLCVSTCTSTYTQITEPCERCRQVVFVYSSAVFRRRSCAVSLRDRFETADQSTA